MRAFWSDPYLWVHLAGLAVVPVLLEVCLVGLAMGDPLLPGWVEIVLVAIAGIAPILWMQWQRPFSIYSLVAVALTPSQLTDDQRRILKIFKSQESRILAAIAAVVLFLVLVKVYDLSPIATPVAPQLVGGRLAGLVIAAIAFLLVNLFVQVPVSVLRALAVSQTAFADTIPYPSEQVGRDFSLLGIGVKRILPPMVMEQPRPKPVPPVTAVSEPSAALADDLWEEPIAPAASLTEPLLEESIGETASATEHEPALSDDAAIAEDWEASASVAEIAEREGDDITPVEDAIAQPPEASEPEGVWETSVEIPTGNEAEGAMALDSETAVSAPPEVSEPGEVWETSVELPTGNETETIGESDLTPEALGEAAIAASTDNSDATDAAVTADVSVDLMADEAAPVAESEVPDSTPTEHTDVRDHSDGSDAGALVDDILSSNPPIEEKVEEHAPTIEQTPNPPEALAFDELFDDPQVTPESPAPDVEEQPDAVGHDLVPEWDVPLQSDPDTEHQD